MGCFGVPGRIGHVRRLRSVTALAGLLALGLASATPALAKQVSHATTTPTTASTTQPSGHKVDICHKGRRTLSIDRHAVDAHLAHGDSLGPCGAGTSTTTTSSTTTTTLAPTTTSSTTTTSAAATTSTTTSTTSSTAPATTSTSTTTSPSSTTTSTTP